MKKNLKTFYKQATVEHLYNPSIWKEKYKDQEFKGILSYIVSSRPV